MELEKNVTCEDRCSRCARGEFETGRVSGMERDEEGVGVSCFAQPHLSPSLCRTCLGFLHVPPRSSEIGFADRLGD